MAPDRASAIRELVRRGVTPTSLVESTGEQRAGRAGQAGVAWGGSPMSRGETASMVRELATGLSAGLPLVPALRTIARSRRRGRQRTVLERVIHDVEHGKSLADAAAAVGPPFTALTISMIRAGESSGKLPEVLTQTADLLDRDIKLRRAVVGATLYPMILGGLICVAIVVLVTFIVPGILRSVEGRISRMPMPTQIVQGLAAFVTNWWWMVLAVGALGLLAARSAYADPSTRLAVDRGLLGIPLIGRLLRDVAVARFTRTLATLSAAGVPLLSALRITSATLNNRAMERVMDDVCDQVTAGKGLAEPMERGGYFPPMLVQVVGMGEKSGRLDQLLAQAATALEERTEASVALVVKALPPALVVIAALIVGFVVLSILLPIMEMQEAAFGG